MNDIEKILAEARAAATAKNLPYTGAVTPPQAYTVLQHVPNARLVDVRTQAEWNWVGYIPGSLQIEWNTWPAGTRNPAFAETLQREVPDKSTPLLFICRSGARSHAAAALAAELGYTNVYNVLEGFEGDKNDAGQRNTVGGWRYHGLPWKQS
ncbi:MAG: rhodanese-like domain-containing protein [Pseudomonadota bacterium]|nr:MAG: rhodanese [Pseudomonadota bacterium]